MMESTKSILTLLAGACLAVAAGCGSDSTTPAVLADSSNLPVENMILGVNHNMTKDGVRTGVLVSDTAFLLDSSRKMDLRNVSLQFFSDNGAPSGTLTSETGEYDVTTGSFVARGDVVLVTGGPEGTRHLETEELHYDVNVDRLWSEVPFVMREGGRTTRGQSFRSDAEFRNWSVTGAETSGGLPQTSGAPPPVSGDARPRSPATDRPAKPEIEPDTTAVPDSGAESERETAQR